MKFFILVSSLSFSRLFRRFQYCLVYSVSCFGVSGGSFFTFTNNIFSYVFGKIIFQASAFCVVSLRANFLCTFSRELQRCSLCSSIRWRLILSPYSLTGFVYHLLHRSFTVLLAVSASFVGVDRIVVHVLVFTLCVTDCYPQKQMGTLVGFAFTVSALIALIPSGLTVSRLDNLTIFTVWSCVFGVSNSRFQLDTNDTVTLII